MQIVPRTGQAPVIDIATRQPVEAKTKPARGGKRDPLPTLTITIPNYGKYQHDVNGRREWVALYSAARHSRQLRRIEPGHRWAFCVLLMLADGDGIVADHTYKDLAFEFGVDDYRNAKRAVEAIASEGLVTVEVKPLSNQKQTTFKPKANHDQTEIKSQPLEDLADDAGQTPPTTTTTTDNCVRETGAQAESKNRDHVREIAGAMAEVGCPVNHIDPAISYRAKAGRLMAREQAVVFGRDTWADWIIQAIKGAGPRKDWETKVNTALQESAIVGAYVPPDVPIQQSQRTPGQPTSPQPPTDREARKAKAWREFNNLYAMPKEDQTRLLTILAEFPEYRQTAISNARRLGITIDGIDTTA